MSLTVEDRPPAAALCPVDGMPLYPTLVGPRCPVCGAAAAKAV